MNWLNWTNKKVSKEIIKVRILKLIYTKINDWNNLSKEKEDEKEE